jgi:hypothetical protein
MEKPFVEIEVLMFLFQAIIMVTYMPHAQEQIVEEVKLLYIRAKKNV